MPFLEGYIVLIDGRPQKLTETLGADCLLMPNDDRATLFTVKSEAKKEIDRMGVKFTDVLIVKVESGGR